MDTDRPSADLHAVHHEIVSLRPYIAQRLHVARKELLHILRFRRRERMVHRIIALRLVIPLQ